MKIVGTREGERRFPNDQFMKANPGDVPLFKYKHLLTETQLRGYQSGKSAAIDKRIKEMEEKEENSRVKGKTGARKGTQV